MSLVAVPFYQKRHRHFDQSYRNIQTRYLLDEYASKKRASTQASSQKSLSQRSSSQRASSQTSLGGTTCRVCAKRVSTQEEEEQENRSRYQSLVAAYGEAKRQRFLSELAHMEENVHLARSQARDKLDKYAIQQMMEDKLAWERHTFEERISRAPEILVRLRSHTVWERMSVTLCFTVQGFPTPVVQWAPRPCSQRACSMPGAVLEAREDSGVKTRIPPFRSHSLASGGNWRCDNAHNFVSSSQRLGNCAGCTGLMAPSLRVGVHLDCAFAGQAPGQAPGQQILIKQIFTDRLAHFHIRWHSNPSSSACGEHPGRSSSVPVCTRRRAFRGQPLSARVHQAETHSIPGAASQCPCAPGGEHSEGSPSMPLCTRIAWESGAKLKLLDYLRTAMGWIAHLGTTPCVGTAPSWSGPAAMVQGLPEAALCLLLWQHPRSYTERVQGFPPQALVDFDDTATYSAVATNAHGQVSTNAAVVVRRFRGDEEPFRSVGLPIGLPLSSVIPYTHFDVQFLEKFGVTFRREGETVTLKCTMLVTPDLKRVQPRAEWYRDDVLVKESKWTKMFFGEGQASLSFSHLHKDDEGLYTLRIVSRGGVSDHSAFLFVRDADPLVTGAPGAPMDLQCHDANRDYVIVTWKPPNTTTESPVMGYFVDRCEVGTNNWVQCNDAPVKICKYPVTGLFEGRSYIFRVRAVNSAGISRPSRVSDAVAALDPLDLRRLQAVHLEGEKEIVIYQDDLEGDVQVPGPPTNVHASEISRNYVVLSWEPPTPRGKDPLMYFIEKSVVGSGSWQRVNAQTAVRSPRYAVFDLMEGKSYVFRVLSANQHGLSEPSEMTSPIEAQDVTVVPSAPGRVLASRNTKTSVVVQWDRPKHEEDLLGYYVDCCVAGTNHWEPCNHKPIGYNRFVVHGLTTGEQYIFRVKAVNAVGMSENSQESDVIKVQAALTVPSHPYGITLLNCDGHSMTLGWKVPKFSGGSPILGYYLDKREVHHENWHEVNSSPSKQTILTVDGLTEGSLYEFKIAAVNLAGIGEPSDPSEHFKCEAWTMPEPGPAYDLTFCEVRDTSLVMLWKAPVYSGSSPVSGYFVDFREEDAGEWITVNQTTTANRYLKVCDLQQGKTYVFRVRAVNANGVGKPSDMSEPVLVEARPGTKEISAGVDEQGNIYLAFDCQEMTDASQFTWCKSYEEIADDERFKIETVGDHSKLYLKNPDKEDLGTYSVSVSDTDGVSSSFVLDPEELERLMALSNEIKNPTIPLKSELAYEIFDKGQVRFWLQAEHLSPDASYRFIINDREVSDSEIHRIKCDKATGIIEMVMDRFTIDNEGTYTVQIHDGKAKSQSSLVLIGDAFRTVLEEAEFQRKEFLRKQGPHFAEYLHWDVTEECEVRLVCKVANTKKETVFKWLKDDVLYETETSPDLERGTCQLLIPKLSKKDHGEYKATLKDDRGQDASILEIAGKVYDDMILAMSRVCGK
ncbi:PREDICTED: myomesin-2 [Cercocebus atys]|uniref:myomesin-2 n=1 Tax=Cercocebus atys TaxID=9531 RepID=UPI0005F549AC|nr:PREDICTED: myomesin-2 [Cercocebus atys]